MERKRRRIIYLIATCLSTISFLSIIFFISPSTTFRVGIIEIPTIIFFFVCLFVSIYFISGLVMRNAIHGILISSFTLVFFLLRFNNLKSPIFVILLLALFIVLEILITSRKK